MSDSDPNANTHPDANASAIDHANANANANANDNANAYTNDNDNADATNTNLTTKHENSACLLNHKSNIIRLLIVIFLSLLFWLSRSILPGVQRNGNLRGSNPTALSAPEILKSGKAYLIYGTAWKADKTAKLVTEAVRAGFRFIDTAGQPKHYNEAGVGNGWTSAAQELLLNRDDLFIQTKFSAVKGQDPNNIPYDKDASLDDQVQQSFVSSLSNLQTDYIDSLILHSPYKKWEDTISVWRVFESFVDDGKVRQLGISNCYDLDIFVKLYEEARIKPVVLQNHFSPDYKFDVKLRDYCAKVGVTYQSFWTLTGNRKALKTTRIKEIADSKKLTPQTLMYAFMMTFGHTPLSGSTESKHMIEDVALMERIQDGEVILDAEEIEEMSTILGIPEE